MDVTGDEVFWAVGAPDAWLRNKDRVDVTPDKAAVGAGAPDI